nr:MAG TPA: hypothetical protein [Caudoviricetes sp.]
MSPLASRRSLTTGPRTRSAPSRCSSLTPWRTVLFSVLPPPRSSRRSPRRTGRLATRSRSPAPTSSACRPLRARLTGRPPLSRRTRLFPRP